MSNVALSFSFFCLDAKERNKEKIKAASVFLLARCVALTTPNSLHFVALKHRVVFTRYSGRSLNGKQPRPILSSPHRFACGKRVNYVTSFAVRNSSAIHRTRTQLPSVSTDGLIMRSKATSAVGFNPRSLNHIAKLNISIYQTRFVLFLLFYVLIVSFIFTDLPYLCRHHNNNQTTS